MNATYRPNCLYWHSLQRVLQTCFDVNEDKEKLDIWVHPKKVNSKTHHGVVVIYEKSIKETKENEQLLYFSRRC